MKLLHFGFLGTRSVGGRQFIMTDGSKYIVYLPVIDLMEEPHEPHYRKFECCSAY